ncbi:MAG: hypothetical protein Q8P61_09720 [Candidatus Nanopelagicales bacterium]|nr:hypothetical protein [Candidatus Nanopelagicales bacterium]
MAWRLQLPGGHSGNGELQQTWTFSSGSRPRAAAISADGKLAHVSLEGANRVSVLDASSGQELVSWPLDKSGYSTPGYVALSKLDQLIGIAAGDCGQTIFVSDGVDPGDVIAVDQPNQC